VETFQLCIPSAPRNEFRWDEAMSTWISTPLLVSTETPTVEPTPFV
jgi:hypothetical protein